jgi:hypothetical protein
MLVDNGTGAIEATLIAVCSFIPEEASARARALSIWIGSGLSREGPAMAVPVPAAGGGGGMRVDASREVASGMSVSGSPDVE